MGSEIASEKGEGPKPVDFPIVETSSEVATAGLPEEEDTWVAYKVL